MPVPVRGDARTRVVAWREPVSAPPTSPTARARRAVELVLERGYDACEIDFESGFWMDYPWAERLGELAREHDIALSVHAPLFGWVGHLEASGRKWASALGALDRSSGIAAACGAELVVFHPGFLLGREPRGRDRRGRRAARCSSASGSRGRTAPCRSGSR